MQASDGVLDVEEKFTLSGEVYFVELLLHGQYPPLSLYYTTSLYNQKTPIIMCHGTAQGTTHTKVHTDARADHAAVAADA